MNWKAVAILILLGIVLVSTDSSHPVRALAFTSLTSLPNADPYDNVFPKLLQLENGSTWMVWEKVVPAKAGEIYLMTNNQYGWSGETNIVTSSFDDISPSIAQLDNGTVILVWSRGISGIWNSYNIYSQQYTGGKWSSPTPLVTTSPSNFDPVLEKMNDGSVWMVWSRSLPTNGNGDLYYKVFRNGSWGAEAIIPTASSPAYEETLPSLTQTADGRIWVVYESNVQSTPQLYATTFDGSTWSSSVALTSTSNADDWPSIVQDRNGGLWVFWARELPNGTTSPPNSNPLYQWDIYYKSSTDNGTSWSADTPLYTSINTDEQHPTVHQGPDKELWIVFDSCCNSPGNPYGNPNLFIIKSDIIPAHDVTVLTTSLSPSPNPRIGENATFTVTVSDPGDYTETTTVNFYVNSALVGTKPITLNRGDDVPVVFVWSSKGHNTGRYYFKATVAPVPHEYLTLNNSINSTFLLTFRGDVDRDGKVSIVDLATLALHLGSTVGSANYYAPADLDNNGVINIFDLTICASDLGKSIP